MSPPLDGCWAKIERANENIKNLEAEIAAFVSPGNQSVICHVDHEAKDCHFTAFGQPIPLRFSVLIGEIVHHLRSSLDHLAWALVLSRHETPDFKTQFPICLTPEKFEVARKGGIMKGISGSAQTIIERVQPYHNTNWRSTAHDSPLMIIHDFDNTDKHKLLAVVVSATYSPEKIHFSGAMSDTVIARIVPEQWADRLLRAEPDGTIALRIEFAKLHSELKVNAQFPFQIAFEQFGTREIEPVIPNLMHLRDATIEAIKLFEGEF
jgi:hypothetical protein